ncbi:hypothetical protein Q3G72_011393 [Acer saccharum]|nr:hypothetical protein Q3G72_011393 [Acer saccharum]
MPQLNFTHLIGFLILEGVLTVLFMHPISFSVASEVETSNLDQSIVRDVLDVRVTLRFQSVDEGDPLGPRVVVVVERCVRGVCVSDDIDSSGGTVPAESNGRERQGFV